MLYDDRDAGPGEKLTDAELLGCPLRIVVGKRGLESGELEAQIRRGSEDRELGRRGAAAEAALTLLEETRVTPATRRAETRPPVERLPPPLRARPLRAASARRPGRASPCAPGLSRT